MFDSLDDKMKHDDAVGVSARERLVKAVMITVLSVLLFGGLIIAVRAFE